MPYARGKKAYGECGRSGKRVRLSDMVEDGQTEGMLVAADWYEPKHPQEIEPDLTDPEALARPAPELSTPDGEGDEVPALTFDAQGKLI